VPVRCVRVFAFARACACVSAHIRAETRIGPRPIFRIRERSAHTGDTARHAALIAPWCPWGVSHTCITHDHENISQKTCEKIQLSVARAPRAPARRRAQHTRYDRQTISPYMPWSRCDACSAHAAGCHPRSTAPSHAAHAANTSHTHATPARCDARFQKKRVTDQATDSGQGLARVSRAVDRGLALGSSLSSDLSHLVSLALPLRFGGFRGHSSWGGRARASSQRVWVEPFFEIRSIAVIVDGDVSHR
jgi:hypothetical protein